eukprot:scaffold190305_cov21-Prasinocladus_malaysianus.AAC.1
MSNISSINRPHKLEACNYGGIRYYGDTVRVKHPAASDQRLYAMPTFFCAPELLIQPASMEYS